MSKEIINEEEIVKKVIQELKNKRLITTPRSSYKSTEKVLYSMKALPYAISLIKKEIKLLEKESKGIPIPESKSKTLVLNERDSTYVYGSEILQTRISELKQNVVKINSQIRIVNEALKKLKEKLNDDKYFYIIDMYYFKKMTIEEIAEKLKCSSSTISENKKKLINELKVLIFPELYMCEY